MRSSNTDINPKPFDLILDLHSGVQRGEIPPDDFFVSFWERMVLLTVEERKKLVRLSEDFAPISELYRAQSVFSRGMSCTFSADFSSAISACQESLGLFKKLNHPSGCMASCAMIMISYKSVGQLDRAQLYMTEAAGYLGSTGQDPRHSFFQAITCYQAGELNVQFGRYSEAVDCYLKGLPYIKEGLDIKGRLESGLGIAYMHLGNNEEAMRYFEHALETIKGSPNVLLESKIYSDIGVFHLRNKDSRNALASQLKALDLREKNNLLNPACTSHILLAEIYHDLDDTGKAIEHALKGIEIATQFKTMIKLFEAHAILSKCYERKGDTRLAFEHYKLYHKYKDEVHNQEVVRKIEQLNTQHRIDSSEKEKEIFRLKNVELRSALEEIHDSFMYASRIQRSLLSSEKYIDSQLKRMNKS